jgi:predicted AlkP superfamily phosphohydrolase/phosphomutase
MGLSTVREMCSRAAGRCPRWLKDLLKARLPALRTQVASMMLLSQVDWARSQAFAICTQYGYIHLNRRDRFPLGVVEPGAETDQVCERLAAELGELREPETGEPAVARVVRPRDLYHGPASDMLPDLVVIWREGYVSRTRTDVSLPASAEASRGVFQPTGRTIEEWSGSHRPDGVLIAHGPDFAAPGHIEGARLIDLAPTLLHLLGQPVPEDMTGRVLEELLDPGFLAENPVRYSAADRAETSGVPTAELSPEESEEVAERLRKMGYL